MPAHQLPVLAPAALADLRQEFHAYSHHPSGDQWKALEALLRQLDDLAGGTAQPALYVSSLDPGVGKTSALLAYLRRLMRSHEHRDVGVLLCLSNLAEIERLTKVLLSSNSSVAARTSSDEINALSSREPGHAQVLVITQVRLELMSRGSRMFAEASALFYHDAPRVLRVWDESFLPGRVVTSAPKLRQSVPPSGIFSPSFAPSLNAAFGGEGRIEAGLKANLKMWLGVL